MIRNKKFKTRSPKPKNASNRDLKMQPIRKEKYRKWLYEEE